MKKDFSPVLYGAFLNCRTEEDVRLLLEDLCTYQELEQLSQRAAAAKLLIEGKTYAEIILETDISSATLSRVSRAVNHGSGGYRKFIANVLIPQRKGN
ncbi:MAG TPA: TrpR YerC/YecD [Candidatus Borkfalkia excrementavium]|uniref:TrpR YerC/YecD n=1 Tax=Candidatus Borkfalkia excrementavium TaxID=2838505 RepID=A0A9D1Z745_9FIRM|nr:TrpR YerC/YecD [Candidatus Borkfalkia excrementavium]